MNEDRYDPPRSMRGSPQPDGIRWFKITTAWTDIYPTASGATSSAEPTAHDQRCTAKHTVRHKTRSDQWVAMDPAVSEFLYDPTRALKPAIDSLVRAHYNPINQHWEVFYGGPTGIPFRNQSGEIIPAYACMRITGGVESGSTQIVTVSKPSTTFQRLYLINGPSQVAVGADGTGTWLSDAAYVLYETGTPAYGESWGPKASQWSLVKWRYGFTIIGTTAGSIGEGTARVWAKQDEVDEVYGQTTGSWALDAAGNVDLYDGNNAAISSTTISATNRFVTSIASGKKVICTWIGGTWLASAAKCV